MFKRSLALAIAAGLLATPALAANAVVDSVLALCAPHHADAGAVFAAAESDGWTMEPDCRLPRTDDARIDGIVGMMNMIPCNLWRTKTVDGHGLRLLVTEERPDWEEGPHRIRSCKIMDETTTLPELEKAVTSSLGAPPQPPQGPITAWIWTEGPEGRTFLPPTTEAILVKALERGPVYALQLDPEQEKPQLIYSEVSKRDPDKP